LGRVPGMEGNQSIHGLDNAVIVIDGVPGRDISNLNMAEVDQVTVLKDANASVLYGVQAQNGVILITTKRGQANKGRVNFSAESGFGTPKMLPKYLNSADYMTMFNLGRKNDGLTALYDSTTIADTRSGVNKYKYPDINYYSSEYLKEIRPFNRVYGEFSGGNERTQYYLNLGWTNTGSLLNLPAGVKNTNNKINLRANVDFEISDNLTSSLDVVTTLDFSDNPNFNFWSTASTMRPNSFPLLLPLDKINTYIDENGTNQPLEALNAAKTFNGGYILGGTSIYKQNNVFGEMTLGGYSRPNERTVQINQGLKYDFGKTIKGLTLSTNISFDLYNTYTNGTNNSYAVYEPKWGKRVDGSDSLVVTKYGSDIQTGNQNITLTSFTRRIAAYGILNYANTFNDVHTVNASVIAYVNSFEKDSILLDQYFPHAGVQLNYGFKQKYLFDFSGSYVHSVKIRKEDRTQFSPTLGIAWVASEEDFLNDSKLVDYLKIKASAGIIKSDLNITNYYLYENTYTGWATFPWADGGRTGSGTQFNSLANPLLNFEKRNNINVGFETSLFSKSLWIEASYFRDNYNGLIGKMANLYPAYLGGFNPTVNYGEEFFQGIDLGINFSKQIGDFKIKLGATMLYSQSEVLKRDELYLDAYQNRVGKRVDASFGLQSDGLYKESDFSDLTKYTLNSGIAIPAFGTVKPGDIKYIDQNKDNVLDGNDEVMIGNWRPDIYYGLNLTLSYKGLTLFALLTGQEGAERNLNGNYYWVYGNAMKYSEKINGAWNVDMTDEQKASATYPRITSTSSTNNFRVSDYWLVDNDFLRIQRIQLTYELPNSILPLIGVKGLSVYLRGSNLLTISKNASIQDLNTGSEPQYRNISAGLKANF